MRGQFYSPAQAARPLSTSVLCQAAFNASPHHTNWAGPLLSVGEEGEDALDHRNGVLG